MSCPPQLIVNDKSQNLRRLQAQRNELNAKGERGEGVKCHVWVEARSGAPSLPSAMLLVSSQPKVSSLVVSLRTSSKIHCKPLQDLSFLLPNGKIVFS